MEERDRVPATGYACKKNISSHLCWAETSSTSRSLLIDFILSVIQNVPGFSALPDQWGGWAMDSQEHYYTIAHH
jgi:hypothetical protein